LHPKLKGILDHPEIERRLSSEGLHHFLSLNYVPCPYTLIDGIEKLPAGHWLEWRGRYGSKRRLLATPIAARFADHDAERERRA